MRRCAASVWCAAHLPHAARTNISVSVENKLLQECGGGKLPHNNTAVVPYCTVPPSPCTVPYLSLTCDTSTQMFLLMDAFDICLLFSVIFTITVIIRMYVCLPPPPSSTWDYTIVCILLLTILTTVSMILFTCIQ